MESTIAILRALETFHNRGVFVEFLLLDGYIYSNDILPNDAPSADVQMPTGDPVFIGNLCKIEVITYPTSELPIRPSLRPTAKPWAASLR